MPSSIHLEAIYEETFLPLIIDISLKIIYLKSHSNLPGPIRRQAIIQTNAWLLSIGPSGTKFSETLIKIQNFSFTKIDLKISSAKWRPFCSGGDELKESIGHLGGIPPQRASNVELCFFAMVLTWTNVELLAIWDTVSPMWRHWDGINLV